MKINALSVIQQGFLKGGDFDFLVSGRAIVDLKIGDIIFFIDDFNACYSFEIVRIEMRRKPVDRIDKIFTGDFYLKSLDSFRGSFNSESMFILNYN
jgi:hypothetical protein